MDVIISTLQKKDQLVNSTINSLTLESTNLTSSNRQLTEKLELLISDSGTYENQCNELKKTINNYGSILSQIQVKSVINLTHYEKDSQDLFHISNNIMPGNQLSHHTIHSHHDIPIKEIATRGESKNTNNSNFAIISERKSSLVKNQISNSLAKKQIKTLVKSPSTQSNLESNDDQTLVQTTELRNLILVFASTNKIYSNLFPGLQSLKNSDSNLNQIYKQLAIALAPSSNNSGFTYLPALEGGEICKSLIKSLCELSSTISKKSCDDVCDNLYSIQLFSQLVPAKAYVKLLINSDVAKVLENVCCSILLSFDDFVENFKNVTECSIENLTSTFYSMTNELKLNDYIRLAIQLVKTTLTICQTGENLEKFIIIISTIFEYFLKIQSSLVTLSIVLGTTITFEWIEGFSFAERSQQKLSSLVDHVDKKFLIENESQLCLLLIQFYYVNAILLTYCFNPKYHDFKLTLQSISTKHKQMKHKATKSLSLFNRDRKQSFESTDQVATLFMAYFKTLSFLCNHPVLLDSICLDFIYDTTDDFIQQKLVQMTTYSLGLLILNETVQIDWNKYSFLESILDSWKLISSTKSLINQNTLELGFIILIWIRNCAVNEVILKKVTQLIHTIHAKYSDDPNSPLAKTFNSN